MSKETSQAQAARRIAGILAMAEDAAKKGNESLRDTYLEKAAALQFQYAVDEALLAQQGQKSEEIVHDDFCQESNTPLIKAKRELIAGLASLYRGKAVMISVLKRDANGELRIKNGKPMWDRRGLVRVYAYESDLAFIRMMYTSLILQMQTMMARDEGIQRPDGAKGWRVSYSHAWVNRVYNRLRTDKAFQAREAEQGKPGTALVLRDRFAEVEKHFASHHSNVRSSSYRTEASANARGAAAGWEAGGRADLNGKKVASTNQRSQIGS